MMLGVLVGTAVALGIAIWQARGFWTNAPQPFAWADVLRQIVPLLLGFIFVQFLFTGDTLFVKHYFTGADTGAYGCAGTLSRALIWLVSPMAAVMFPRIVHSSAKAQETDILGIVMIGTAVLAICGAVGLSIVGRWLVAFVAGADFVPVATKVMPWYAFAMVPLALANVLVNNLLARSRFAVVPLIFLLCVGYAVAMIYVNESVHTLRAVLQTLGAFNVLLLGVCAWFTWGSAQDRRQRPQ